MEVSIEIKKGRINVKSGVLKKHPLFNLPISEAKKTKEYKNRTTYHDWVKKHYT